MDEARARAQVRQITREAAAGTLTRRDVLRRGALLGLSAPAIAALLAACGGSGGETATSATGGQGQSSSSTSSTTGGATPGSTASGGQAATKRGEGGQLKLLWWQAPVNLNCHIGGGVKDIDAARIVQEPLADFAGEDAHLVPKLAAEIPSIENGGVAKDGTGVTWKLASGLKWSDGEPVTSKDVKFTYDYVIDEKTSATTIGHYLDIASVETPDDLTVKITFKKPTPTWFDPFCGSHGVILPQHLLKDSIGEKARNDPFNLKPVGTGPFKVDDFKPGDMIAYSANENYREPGKPFFATIDLKGGGDATSAARAALQTGDVDYAWNLQITPEIMKSLEAGGQGKILIYKNLGLEMIAVNQTDPNKEVNGERSHLGTPHPFQSDVKVRQAYALATQRDVIAQSLYGPAGSVGINRINTPPRFVSKNTSWKYDLDAAGKLLDEAGWAKGSDGTRAKDGVKMEIVYQTTVNPVRQRTQEIVKDSFQKLGITVTLKSVDASVFFSPDAGNPDTSSHFYADIEMYASTLGLPYRIDTMRGYYGATENIAQKANNWTGDNSTRWQNAEYDKLYDQATTELDEDTQNDLFIKMNDLVVNDVAIIPLVVRNGVSAAANGLEGMELTCWNSEVWNIANWVRKK